MVIMSNSTKKGDKDILRDKVNPNILRIVFAFVCEDVFDQVVTGVGLATNWGMFPPIKGKRIYSQYDECAIHFHECIFSLIGYRLTFNDFEVIILNHLFFFVMQNIIYLLMMIFELKRNNKHIERRHESL